MLIKKTEFCDADESSQPPPVPPRRKRSSTANERPTKLERKHRAAPPLPPPAAPQRARAARKTPSPYPNENCSSAVSSTFDSLECGEASRNSLTETDENARVEDGSPKSSRKSRRAPKKPERSPSPCPFEKPPEPNKYPPLYFTFQDFQTVMEGSLKHERQKSEERPQEPEAIPFTENVEFDNDREEIYFRVTTTDRPFKNILTDWSKSYDGDVEDFEREPQGDHIFEDYMDRSNKANKHLLINQQYFAASRDEVTAERSTKVRFVVESPSTSTPDTDLDYTSYKEFVDKQLQQHCGSVQLTEIHDEESVEASGISECKSASEVDISDEPKTGEDENTPESLDAVDANQASDSHCDSIEDAKVISVAERIGEVLHYDEEEEGENIPRENEEVDVYRDDTIDSEESQEVNERRKLFIDSSLYNLSNEDDDWSAYLDRKKIKPQSSEAKSSEAAENQEQRENPIENSDASVNAVPREVPKIEISTFDEKSVPESVRRNSFLEHMLDSDDPNASAENSEGANCEVIAAHPKYDLEQEEAEEENARSSREEEVAKAPAKGGGGSGPVIKSAAAGRRSSAPSRINASPGNKSAGEVKSDVLNELLTNFGAIKLRPVNGAAAELTKAETDDETHEIRSSSEIKAAAKIESRASGSTTSPGRDTSAIVKEAPQLAERRRFDTDNKVETPLAVNKDQIREAIAIIPGSVRNYIKYYEIHSEINSIAKLKDSVCRRTDKPTAKKSTKGFAAPKPAAADDAASPSPPSSPRPGKQQQSCMKSLSPKPERKKSVQFDSEFTVINPPKKPKDTAAKKEEDEGTFSSFIGGIGTRLKRKAPVKPDVKKDDQPKGLSLKEERRGDAAAAAAVICIQKSPEPKALTTIPGNRSFLPQTETLQNSPTIVFYCTV